MSDELKKTLEQKPQTVLNYTHQLWQAHDSVHKPQFSELLSQAYSNAKNTADPENLPDFPQPLVEYRRVSSMVSAAMLYFSEAGEIHPDIYIINHFLGLIKDVYYTGLLPQYPDWNQYREKVIDTQVHIEDKHLHAASRSAISNRLDTIFSSIETQVKSDVPIPVSLMHDVRKLLRGFAFMLAVQQTLKPDSKTQQLESDIKKIVKELGELHDTFITILTENTEDAAEFNREYAKQTILLVPKLRQRIIKVLHS